MLLSHTECIHVSKDDDGAGSEEEDLLPQFVILTNNDGENIKSLLFVKIFKRAFLVFQNICVFEKKSSNAVFIQIPKSSLCSEIQ